MHTGYVQCAYRWGMKCNTAGAETACYFIRYWDRHRCNTSSWPKYKRTQNRNSTEIFSVQLIVVSATKHHFGSTQNSAKTSNSKYFTLSNNVNQKLSNKCSPGHCISGVHHTPTAGINVTHGSIDIRCTVVALQWQQATCRTVNVNIHHALLLECHLVTGHHNACKNVT